MKINDTGCSRNKQMTVCDSHGLVARNRHFCPGVGEDGGHNNLFCGLMEWSGGEMERIF